MLRAESTMNPCAERYGTQTRYAQAALREGDYNELAGIILEEWPDISFGLSQMTVQTASGYKIGNGAQTVDNVLYVRKRLFDRATAIEVGVKHLAGCYAPNDYLQTLIKYNSGDYHFEKDWYWEEYLANIEAYKSAIEWANEAIK